MAHLPKKGDYVKLNVIDERYNGLSGFIQKVTDKHVIVKISTVLAPDMENKVKVRHGKYVVGTAIPDEQVQKDISMLADCMKNKVSSVESDGKGGLNIFFN